MTSENKPKQTKQNRKEDGEFRSVNKKHGRAESTRTAFSANHKRTYP